MLVIGLVLVGGCDKLFSVDHVVLADAAPPDIALDAPDNVVVGCADGTREWLLDQVSFPTIAGCAGGWSTLGVHHPQPPTPLCPGSGNDNPTNPAGSDCDVNDLCAPGWHLCADPVDVGAQLGGKPCRELTGVSSSFFVTATHSLGATACAPTGDNDLFGCGSVGLAPDSNCGAIDRTSGDNCAQLPFEWNCGTDGSHEAAFVTKAAASGGGAMCCKN